jgi:hypothetical protein
MDGCKLNINLSTQINKIGHHFVIAKNGRYILELYLAVATYKVDIFCEANTEILDNILWNVLQKRK